MGPARIGVLWQDSGCAPPFSPDTVWYVQAGALIAGHVVGLAVAHDRAVTIFRDRQDVLRSQYAMLALMVLYTVGGLWLLSRG